MKAARCSSQQHEVPRSILRGGGGLMADLANILGGLMQYSAPYPLSPQL